MPGVVHGTVNITNEEDPAPVDLIVYRQVNEASTIQLNRAVL